MKSTNPDARWVVSNARRALAGPRPVLPLLLCGGLFWPGRGDAQSPVVAVRDSAGVEIVDNQVALDELPVRRLAPKPSLRIGIVEGEEPYQFDRVNGVTPLSDGRVVVSNWGTQELRFFDRDGRFQFAAGGRGEGPGEFARFTPPFRRPGDTLVVYDGGLQRVTRLGSEGELVSSRRLEMPGKDLLYVAGVFDDGSMLAVALAREVTGPSRFESDFIYLRYGPDGSLLDSLGADPAGTLHHQAGRFWIPPLFEASPVVAVAGDGYARSGARDYAFHLHRLDGSSRRTVRWRGPDRTITDEELDRHWERQLARVTGPDERRALEERRATTPVADRFPAIAVIEMLPSGRVWVRSYDRPGASVQEWLIFAPDGRLEGRAELPLLRRFFPRAITETRIFGVETDELGVEFVVIYDLVEGR